MTEYLVIDVVLILLAYGFGYAAGRLDERAP